MKSWLLSGIVLAASMLNVSAQNLINVKPYTSALSGVTGVAVVGASGDTWNALGNLQTNSTGYLTNAATIKDSSGTDVSGVSMTLAINTTSQPLSGYSSTAYSANPAAIMNSYVYDGNGDYFTVVFSGLPVNFPYMVYGLGTGNAQAQGTTWWMDAANGHGTATCTANFTSGTPLGTRDATQATNEGVCWVKIPATTTAAGGLTFRVCKLGATESGGVVSGGSGRAYFNAFQLQPASSPVISNLTNQTVIAGGNAVLNPTIAGVPTPACQWCSNSVPIAGATNASFALNNVQSAQNGVAYSLVASNWVGAVTNSMDLTVIVAPGITGLANLAVSTGSNVTNAPTVSGVPSPATRWQVNSVNLSDGPTGNGSTISGSSTSVLVLLNAQPADSGAYSLIASNSAGIVTNRMTLTVSSGDVAPAITGPTDQTVVQSNNATFSASVSGLPVPTLQWRVNGTNIMDATKSALTVSNVQYAQNGFAYSLVASNRAGLTTNSATLYVLVPPAISRPPANVSAYVGSPAVFSVTASGVPAVIYQWRKNGNPIAMATNASYTVASTQGSDNGASFTVTVSNSVGVVTSSSASLTVLSTMTGTFLPTNGAVKISPDQQLRIVFTGGSPILNTNGVIRISDAANNSVVATIDSSQFLSYVPGNTSIQVIPNAAIRTEQGSYSGTGSGTTTYYYMPIALYGNQAWMTFTNPFSYGHTYYVTCDTGLFLDSTGASFPGITATNTWTFSIQASGPATPTASMGPTNITIGLDGTGDFATFQGAFNWLPANNTLPRTIQVLPGIYRDSATLAGNRNYVTIVGQGNSRTNAQLIYPFTYFAPPNSVFTAGSLRIESSDVTVLNLTLDNIIYNVYHPTGNSSSGAATNFAGAINTLATSGQKIVFENDLIKGGQDTIYNITGIIYYNNCEVWGSVDFIYGAALAVFDQCNIVEIRPTGGPCTAPNTAYAQPYGITFLNCTYPQAFVTSGYPYDVGAATTTFMRPWGQNGYTANINSAIGNQFNPEAYQTFGNTNEDTCRAREYGTTMIGGGLLNIPQIRWNAGAYWANTFDPDYTNNPSLLPTDPLLAPPTGTNNRVVVTVNPSNYTLATIFGNSYFNLSGWMPTVTPTITSQPTNQSTSGGQPVLFAVSATGLPNPVYQWLLNGSPIFGQTNAALIFASVNISNAGTYSVVVSNSVGALVSSNAVLSVANSAPSLTPVSDQTINAGVTLNVTNFANDVDAPPQVLTFSLLTGPSNSTLSTSSGVFNWRPSASQGGTTNQVSVRVADNGTPSLNATNNFRVIVNPVSKPSLGAISYDGTQFNAMVSSGTVGPDYVVEVSTNLAGWQVLLTTNSPPQAFTFVDAAATNAAAKFYRVRLSP